MGKEKSQPLLSFNIPILLNITISGKKEFLYDLEKQSNKKGLTKTEYLNKWLLKKLRESGIKGYKDLLTQSGDYELLRRSAKDSLTGFLSTSNLSRFITEELKKEWDNENKN